MYLYDEDSGEELHCTFCGESGECPHLLVVVNDSDTSWVLGYAKDRRREISDEIESVFQDALQAGAHDRDSAPVAAPDPEGRESYLRSTLNELWQLAVDQFSPDDGWAYLDDAILNQLIYELLDQAGAEENPTGKVVSDDGFQGSEMTYTAYYADNPQEKFEKAIVILQKVLGE